MDYKFGRIRLSYDYIFTNISRTVCLQMDDLLDFFPQSDFHQTLGNGSFSVFTFILAFFVSIGPMVVELSAVEKRWPRDHFHIKCDNNSEKYS